jgi:large subunit ribosomal protein L4
MATVDVVAMGGGKAGSVELDASVFEAPIKRHLFHAEVRRQLASRRAGTHATKNRAAVSGGGAKPYRQKGTGRARQGTTRAPQFAGGGSVFGPVPRSYDHKLPKKMRRAALRAALSLRQKEGALKVADGLELDAYKTRKVVEMLGNLGVDGSVLLVLGGPEPYLEKSARNVPGVAVIRVEGLNVYDVLRHKEIVIAKSALESIGTRLRAGEAS